MKQDDLHKATLINNLFAFKNYFILFAIAGILLCLYDQKKPLGDYANYYFGSKFLYEGVPAQDIYDPATFNKIIAEEGVKGVFVNYAPVPPFSLLFFVPFTVFDLELSKLLFNVLSFLIFTISLYRLCSLIDIKRPYLFLIGVIIAIPLQNNILQGQTYLLITASLCEGYIALRKQKEQRASLLFALPIALKIFPAIVLFWLFFTRRKKTLILTILFSTLLFLIVIPFTGVDLLEEYVFSTLPRLSAGEILDPYTINYQSFTVLLRKVFVYDRLLNPAPFLDAVLLFDLLNTLFSALVLTLNIYLIRKNEENTLFTFGLTLFCGLLISGYGTSYSLILMIFLALALLISEKNPTFKLLYLFLFLGINTIPVNKLYDLPLTLQFMRLALMLALFITILLTHRARIISSNYLVIFLLLLTPSGLKYARKQDNNFYYLDQEPSLLISEYKSHPKGILIYHPSNEGIDSTLYHTRDHIYKSTNLTIQNNQIYYNGKQLTIGSDHKKQPMRLNHDQVIYLSDQGRGVNLFAIRKIDIKTNPY